MSTALVPRADGRSGEIRGEGGSALAQRLALSGRPLLSGQGEQCPNLVSQDQIRDFQLIIRELWCLDVRCGGLGYSMGVRHTVRDGELGFKALEVRLGGLNRRI